jgi:3-methyladenine DNA glycosylase AlkD
MSGLAEEAARRLTANADPDKAALMAAYMKSEIPFYGVQKPGRKTILRDLVAAFAPVDGEDYRHQVAALWSGEHREEKYLAIGYARHFHRHVELSSLELYGQMIIEGAWWDFVDEIASHLIGTLVLDHRPAMRPVLEEWIESPDMWLRRTAILGQLRHKDRTDADMLFDFCLRRAHEDEFFIRKAIGWALREYAKTDPDRVREFLATHGESLSPLSRREASKHLY